MGRLDRLQRSTRPTAIAISVVKKYGDDRGGSLAALITFYGFLSVFPLLLLLVTVAGLVLGPNSHAEHEIVNSALSQFPVVGKDLGSSIRALHRATPLAFVVSAVGLLWGSLGVTNHLQRVSEIMWDVPRHEQADLKRRVLRSLMLLGTIGVAVLGSAVLTGISTIGGGTISSYPVAYWTYTLVGAGVVNLLAYLLVLHILAPEGTRWRTVLPGTLVGGLGWTALEAVGGLLVSHELRHATQLYGFFATVLGLVFWLSLGSQLFVYAGESNVVLARRLWPRHLNDPPPAEPAGGFDYDGALVVIETGAGEIVFIHPPGGPPDATASLPSNPCDPGESPQEAAVRLALQMTGLEVEVIREFTSFIQPGTPTGTMRAHAYIARVTGGSLTDDGPEGAARAYPLGALPAIIPIRVANRRALGAYLEQVSRA